MLIIRGRTQLIRSASIARLLMLILALGGLLFFTSLNRLIIAVWAMLVSSLVDVLYVT